jgi:isoamylase
MSGQRDQAARLVHRGKRSGSHPLCTENRKAPPRIPPFCRRRFLTGACDEELGVKDVTWINANGSEMEDQDWGKTDMQCFGMLMDGRSQSTGIRQRGQDATMLLVMNAHSDVVGFTLPGCTDGNGWRLLVDTNIPDEEAGSFAIGDQYGVTARSLLYLSCRPRPGDKRLKPLRT